MDVQSKSFLVYFACTHTEFRVPEFEAVADVEGIPMSWRTNVDMKQSPFIYVNLPSDNAAITIAKRCVTVKGIYEIWGEGATYDDTIAAVKQYTRDNESHVARYAAPDVTFKLVIESFGRSIPRTDQLKKMKLFEFLAFKGTVRMENPNNVFVIVEDHGMHGPKEAPPKRVYFGRQIAAGQRDLIDKYNLKKRIYLGTTSFDAELSLISANQARVKPGSLMFDPFAGTGSFLVSCAHFGAMTMGADIDIRVLRGKEPGKNVYANMAQYKITENLVDVVRFDFSRNSVWKSKPHLDAIITDPPYGVRAGAKKVGKRDPEANAPLTDLPEGYHPHIAQTVPYHVPEVLGDLLDFSARNLVFGAHLVYWLPTTDQYKHEDLPKHPCLQLISNSEQVFNSKFRRRLITMRKVVEYDPKLHANLPPVEYDPEELGHGNFAAKIMKDPTRKEKRPIKKQVKSDETSEKEEHVDSGVEERETKRLKTE